MVKIGVESLDIKNVTSADLVKALRVVNEKYEDNITWNNYEQLSEKRFRITLRVENSHGKGARKGTLSGRALIYACWHVHGDFFDALLSMNPEAIIKSAGRTITKDGGNWEDWNIGSLCEPLYYSLACDCEA